MEPADDWSNIPRSFSPAIAGTLMVDEVTNYVAAKIEEEGESLPLEVYILAYDTTDDGVVNYNAYVLNVNSKVVKQFTTRITGNRNRWAGLFRCKSRALGSALQSY